MKDVTLFAIVGCVLAGLAQSWFVFSSIVDPEWLGNVLTLDVWMKVNRVGMIMVLVQYVAMIAFFVMLYGRQKH